MKNTIYSQKSELDQFFTNENIAKQCYFELCKLYNVDDFDLLLEPSAGNGVFLKLLPKDKRLGLDLDPKFEEIKQMDFFEFTFALRGKLSLNEISAFEKQIKSFHVNNFIENREQTKLYKSKLNKSYIILNPKIDINQKRLQCSVNLKTINLFLTPTIYISEYRGLHLPIKIDSKQRMFI